MDTPPEVPGETPNQRQARLRRERRNAQLQAGGSERLAKITGASGRPAPAPESPPVVSTPPVSQTPDPKEVDISEHYYKPSSRSRTDLQTFDSSSAQDGSGLGNMNNLPQNPFAAFLGLGSLPGSNAPSSDSPNDPMLAILSQLLQGQSPDPNDPNAAGGLPPGLAEMFGAGGQTPPQQRSSTSRIWAIVHFVFSLSLVVYVALYSNFTGTVARTTSPSSPVFDTHSAADGLADGVGKRLFWLFATAELVLQSTRFFLERGELRSEGLLGSLSRMLPEPWSGWIRVVGRYGVIWRTVVGDAMVVVFVLGMWAWWNGTAVA
ncbi:hypothetical protein M501DRAFT_1000080 [Patellaria atrata CBS 101060]|uniref:Uncharacterized protein n=1 Tax=Patellaria atrata CBS 101060 TaxID=1346257 RepID=A0A9P4S1Q0_9PEZI|nr:hypothetical protein M501DRAFT_1000080 [Patellaria atrata CBS 101060]